jgi:rhodanese-related sulfurtransferase
VADSITPATGGAEPHRLTPAEAHGLLAAGRAVLADVRDPANYQNSHASGAVSLPLASVRAAGGRLPTGFLVPEGAVLVLYCA